MTKYILSVDEETCIGCGACTATCSDHFEMLDTKDGQKAKPKKAEVDSLECAKDAAEICPVNAIHVSEDGKKLI